MMLQYIANYSPAPAILGRFNFRFWKWTALAVLAVPCLVVLFTFDPARQVTYTLCPFSAVTGFDCPGCGTLRGLHQLLQGNFLAALDLNPLMVLTLPFLVLAFSAMLATEITGKRTPSIFIPAKWIWGLLVVIIVFSTLRNLPVEPLTVLASG